NRLLPMPVERSSDRKPVRLEAVHARREHLLVDELANRSAGLERRRGLKELAFLEEELRIERVLEGPGKVGPARRIGGRQVVAVRRREAPRCGQRVERSRQGDSSAVGSVAISPGSSTRLSTRS